MWTATAEQKRNTIARWVREGLQWRTWTISELTWVLHRELIEDLHSAGQTVALRDYLRITGDKATLGALARETMGQTQGVSFDEPPPLRGR